MNDEWITGTPTEPGWYWRRHPHGMKVADKWTSDGRWHTFHDSYPEYHPTPITPPPDPKPEPTPMHRLVAMLDPDGWKRQKDEPAPKGEWLVWCGELAVSIRLPNGRDVDGRWQPFPSGSVTPDGEVVS
jgi:hypothetical protein